MPLTQTGKKLLNAEQARKRYDAEVLVVAVFCLALAGLILWSMFR